MFQLLSSWWWFHGSSLWHVLKTLCVEKWRRFDFSYWGLNSSLLLSLLRNLLRLRVESNPQKIDLLHQLWKSKKNLLRPFQRNSQRLKKLHSSSARRLFFWVGSPSFTRISHLARALHLRKYFFLRVLLLLLLLKRTWTWRFWSEILKLLAHKNLHEMLSLCLLLQTTKHRLITFYPSKK